MLEDPLVRIEVSNTEAEMIHVSVEGEPWFKGERSFQVRKSVLDRFEQAYTEFRYAESAVETAMRAAGLRLR